MQIKSRPDGFNLDVSLGRIAGVSGVQVNGHAPDGAQTTLSDIWGRADATPTQQIWLAPTAARIHAIVSGSAADVAASTGATSVTVTGLTSWSTAEVSEVVNLNGVTPVNTANSYVIINTLEANASATTTQVGVNTGLITATAATDGTVTAVILAAKGRSQQAIYGLPSVQTLCIENYHASLHDLATSKMRVSMSINKNPNVQTVAFITRHLFGMVTGGSSAFDYPFNIPLKIVGPAIVKLQTLANAADLDVSAGFDGFLVTN